MDYFKWKHVIQQKNEDGDIIAARLIVYAGEADEYYSFLTLEAYNALLDYMDFCAAHGEKIDCIEFSEENENWMPNKLDTLEYRYPDVYQKLR